jgi:hypothetical protein
LRLYPAAALCSHVFFAAPRRRHVLLGELC